MAAPSDVGGGFRSRGNRFEPMRWEESDPVAPEQSLADAERALAAAGRVRGKPELKVDLLRYLTRAAIALEGRLNRDPARCFLRCIREAAQF